MHTMSLLRLACASCLAFASVPLMVAPAHAQETVQAAPALQERVAAGELSAPGGARRLSGDISEAYRAQLQSGRARNVILLIGDGMGDSEITLARNYARGAGGAFKGIDALPVSGHYTHYSLDAKTGKPDYVTDSAASATAWATGVKTYNGAIGVDLQGRAWPTLLQKAKAAGLAVGNVSTAAVQDATPAAQYAHVAYRACFGPVKTSTDCPRQALENGGPGSISEQILDARPDVVLGGGRATFDETARAGKWKNRPLIDQARARGFVIVEDAQALASVRQADQKAPLLGLFAPRNMPVRWMGPRASRYGNLEKPPVRCEVNPERTASIPTLAAMTQRAIELLDARGSGFFLQVEGASIDKENHGANPCGQIGETVDLDEAVQVALDFARRRGDTLVIVTADHAHTSQIISNRARSPGLSAALITEDGAVMSVNYATSEEGSQGHTGTQLRIAAYGPGAANVTGLTDQTDLHYTIAGALGLEAGQTAPASR